jgi:hypothetical protein
LDAGELELGAISRDCRRKLDVSGSTTAVSAGEQLKGAISHRRLYGRCMFLRGEFIVLALVFVSGGNLLNRFSVDAMQRSNHETAEDICI